jgi:hypothetical protein
MASGNNAWCIVDSAGQVRHVITPKNADGNPGFREAMEAAINARIPPTLRTPNDVWQDTDQET